MAHINDQIRSAVVAAVTGLATTGARVDQDFLTVRNITEPRLLVRVNTEKVETDISGNQERVIKIAVSAYAKESAPASTLGDIQTEVETALQTAGTLGGLVASGLVLQGDERDLEFDTLEKPAGTVTLIYGALCFTRAGQPETVA